MKRAGIKTMLRWRRTFRAGRNLAKGQAWSVVKGSEKRLVHIDELLGFCRQSAVRYRVCSLDGAVTKSGTCPIFAMYRHLALHDGICVVEAAP